MNKPPPDLAGDARRGTRFTSLASAAVIAFQLCQIAVLARLLVPADFAVATIASVAVSLLSFYADFGLSGAIVHFRDADRTQLSTLYWLNVAAGVLLAGLLILLSPYVADYFASPKLRGTLQLLSPAILLSAIGGQYRAIHQRDLAFGILAWANTVNAAASFVIAVAGALLGLGVYSIALGAVAGSAAATSLVIATSPSSSHPSRYFRLQGVKPFLRFGGYQVAERTLGFINTQIDVLILGKFAGMTDLGRYAPMKTLCTKPVALINPILTSVAFPVMSATHSDRDRLARIYLLQVRAIVSVTAPLYLFTLINASPITTLFLGPQWIPAANLLRWLAIYGLLVSMGNPVGSLLLATGRARSSFLWNLALSAVVPLAAIVASPYGVTAIAIAMTAVEALLLLPGWRYLIWPSSGASLRAYLNSLARPTVLAALAAFTAFPMSRLHASPWLIILLTGIVGGIAYAALSLIFNRDIVNLLRQTVLHKRTAEEPSNAHTAD